MSALSKDPKISKTIPEPAEVLYALGPLDGRYAAKTAALRPYFSEFGLMQYRARVEVEYLIALAHMQLPKGPVLYSADEEKKLRAIYQKFGAEDAEAIKTYEAKTNHDVKALEYWLQDKIKEIKQLDDSRKAVMVNFIHFGLTSQDVNNTAIPLLLKEAMHQVLLPQYNKVLDIVLRLANKWKAVPMLAHTHGQPATPTTVGKELLVFADRLRSQLHELEKLPYPGKFGGATGNLNAHIAAYPNLNWENFAEQFLSKALGLQRSRVTTQIDQYDGLARIMDCNRRANVILMDMAKDIWQYIAMEYFGQKVVAGEVGSSTMPHKVNPIDFENAEGNLGMANALFEHLSAKLPISRLQRDLTDSTVLRNLGIPLGHSLLALASLEKGLNKLELNEYKVAADLDSHPEVLGEAIQTILRREGIPNAYELLKGMTRGQQKQTLEQLREFITTLPVDNSVKDEMLALTPANYTGNATEVHLA